MINSAEFDHKISSYTEQIEQLFEFVEEESDFKKAQSLGSSSSTSPGLTRSGLHSSSASSINNYGEFGTRRAEAPTKTKCGGGCDWSYGGDGGQTAVNILNAVGDMTTQIINASANVASVVLPPVVNATAEILPPVVTAMGNVIRNVIGGKNQPPPSNPQGQWVWNNGKWEWDSTGQQSLPPPPPPQQYIPPPPPPPPQQYIPPPPPPPPPQQYTPPPPPPQGQWEWINNQWQWVPGGQQSYGGNATLYLNQPAPTRSRIPQKMGENTSESLDFHSAIQKIHQDIHHTLKDMDKCVDRILSKLS